MSRLRDLKQTDIVNFQWQILSLQMALEDSFTSLAKDSGRPCVILCDRGVMDGSAYVTLDQWEELKLAHELDTVTLRDTCVLICILHGNVPSSSLWTRHLFRVAFGCAC